MDSYLQRFRIDAGLSAPDLYQSRVRFSAGFLSARDLCHPRVLIAEGRLWASAGSLTRRWPQRRVLNQSRSAFSRRGVFGSTPDLLVYLSDCSRLFLSISTVKGSLYSSAYNIANNSLG